MENTLLTIKELVSEAQCYEAIRKLRWQENISCPLEKWGFQHKMVNYCAGEYARGEDGDGFCEVLSNTMEGFWSLLRPWLRGHTLVFHKISYRCI
jgi:hypothetical protein